ncbi:ribonuclease H-like domain-containing protein, partial [Tanacetum coccineum]
FDMTDLGALNYFLGISVDHTPTGYFGFRHSLICVIHYWLVILMLIGRVVHLHASLPQVIVSFWVITYYIGSLNHNTLFHALVLKLNIGGVANVVAVTAWFRNLLCELHSSLSTATLVYRDNINDVYMPANPV